MFQSKIWETANFSDWEKNTESALRKDLDKQIRSVEGMVCQNYANLKNLFLIDKNLKSKTYCHLVSNNILSNKKTSALHWAYEMVTLQSVSKNLKVTL